MILTDFGYKFDIGDYKIGSWKW